MPLPANHIVTADEFAAASNDETFDSLGGCSLSTASASYVNITNASKSFTKYLAAAASDLLVEVSLTAFSGTASVRMKIGVNISADTDVTLFFFNDASKHLTITGRARVTGLAAGAYTVQLRALSVNGATMTIGADDTVSFGVKEDIL
jgi:hypothetical protein